MLRFEGDRALPGAPTDLFARLTDARFLVECIPDVESVSAVAEDHAQLVLRPGFSFVRGTLEVQLRVGERTASSHVQVLLASKGIGSSSEVEANLHLTPGDAGTQVHWVAEVKALGGLLKLAPQGLIRGAAEKVINDAWDRLASRLEA